MFAEPANPIPTASGLDRLEESREDLAKRWLVRLIERTALSDLEDLPVAWIVREGPPLIADIVRELERGDRRSSEGASALAKARATDLLALRRGERAASELAHDIGALQALIVTALHSEAAERDQSFAESVQRLADVFADIHAAVAETLVHERTSEAKRDPLTGLPGQTELDEWMSALIADSERYGRPFALLGVDLDGLKRINEAFGRRAGDALLIAVGGLLRNETRTVDRVFRMRHDDFCVLAPNQEAQDVVSLAQRLRKVVEISQSDNEPRVDVSIGVVSCPRHGNESEALLSAATEARYAARASGEGVSVGA